MRLLTYTTLYPNRTNPQHGIFVETRLRHILREPGTAARVLAPVPWFPFAGAAFGRYAGFAAVPAREEREGVEVLHPRYPLIPKVGMRLAPAMLAHWSAGPACALARSFDFDLIDAHYFYPDGVAAARLARRLGRPFVVTARGSDINLIPDYPGPRRMILEAADQAAAVVAVSSALKDRMVALGIPAEKIAVLRNGVDTERFRPTEGGRARLGLPADAHVVLCVGNLAPVKAFDLAIDAIARLPDSHLLIAGEGPARAGLEAQVRRLGLEGRVRLLGRQPQQALPELYSAADALVLSSVSEGWPNVLLEAMACGTPAVAVPIPGMAEVIAAPAAGRIAAARSAEGLADALRALRAELPARAATRAYAEGFGWQATARGLLRLFEDILSRRRRA